MSLDRSRPLLVATRSAGKLRELVPLFASHGIPIIDLVEASIAESPDEDELEVHGTFEENALAKARYFFARSGEFRRSPTTRASRCERWVVVREF